MYENNFLTYKYKHNHKKENYYRSPINLFNYIIVLFIQKGERKRTEEKMYGVIQM